MEIFSKTIILLILAQLSTQDKLACPQYSCDTLKESDQCAYVKASQGIMNYATLADNCKKDEFCDVDIPPWKTISYLLQDTTYTCKKKEKEIRIRYPGEDCKTHENCIHWGVFKSLCKNGKCTGTEKDQGCSNTYECMKGLYCDKDSRACAKQKPSGASCLISEECENKHLCHENKCGLKPYSAEFGTNVENSLDKLNYAKCKLGWTDDKQLCTQLIQQNSKCSLRVMCNYGYSTDDHGTFTRECECGYNSTGQGYCPPGHDKSKK
jgi:hypothetical protein